MYFDRPISSAVILPININYMIHIAAMIIDDAYMTQNVHFKIMIATLIPCRSTNNIIFYQRFNNKWWFFNAWQNASA